MGSAQAPCHISLPHVALLALCGMRILPRHARATRVREAWHPRGRSAPDVAVSATFSHEFTIYVEDLREILPCLPSE